LHATKMNLHLWTISITWLVILLCYMNVICEFVITFFCYPKILFYFSFVVEIMASCVENLNPNQSGDKIQFKAHIVFLNAHKCPIMISYNNMIPKSCLVCQPWSLKNSKNKTMKLSKMFNLISVLFFSFTWSSTFAKINS
jgi:hypothetical protein